MTFTDYASARTKLDELNALAGLQNGDDLTSIYVDSLGTSWVINGTDCIDNGGLGVAQITSIVQGLPSFTVNTYDDFFNLGYVQANI
jgi:hypothetical protein